MVCIHWLFHSRFNMRISLATFLVICLEFLCHKGRAQSNQCKENEEFQECASGCPLTCKNYRESYFCDIQCKSGCFCRPGYVKGPGDKCMRPSQCPIGPCNDNEIESTCMNPCNNCIQKGKCYFEYCIKGCDCKPGYYRNSSDICVMADKCGSETHLCPPNEHYATCVNNCNDCWSKGKHCSEADCVPGCDCNSGYFRDDYGTCVPEQQCDNHDLDGICGANEIFSECVGLCNDCEHKGHCDHHECHYGCDCKIGYFRDHDGHCIPESECAAMTCGHYEEYSDCGTACPISCDNYNKQVPCTLHCVKGCFCSRGYIRGPGGTCIRPNECPKVCGEYEEYNDCGTSCPLHCSNLTSSSTPCPTICVKGCFCQAGYVRGPNGKCILRNACPPICDDKEIFMSCGPHCEPSCEAIHRNSALCPGCQERCYCKPGYVRGPDGKCILPTFCPAECGENEEFNACGSACPANCSNPYPTCPKTCIRGCFCKPGFIRNSNYKCILPASCPIDCNEYEEFKECGSYCPPTCADRNRTCSGQCVRGCFCKSGYIKDPNGKCVLPSQCPETCPENETYRLCGTNCPITCHNIGKAVTCKQHCVSGCFCNDGFVRGDNAVCIRPELCPMRCGQNEVLKECGTACQLTCANYTSLGPCAALCVKGCFCRRGYVRNSRGKCITTKHCPARCKEHEVFSCSIKSCESSCQDGDDYSRPCIGECINGCYCRRGFVRALDGNCVQRSECPRINRFDGRNIGGEGEENDNATLSSTPAATKSSSIKDSLSQAPTANALLTTQASLLSEALPTTQAPLSAKAQITTQAPLSAKAQITTQAPLLLAEALLTTQAPLSAKAQLKTQAPLSANTKLTTQAPLPVKALLTTQVPLAAKALLTTQVPLVARNLLTQAPLITKDLLTQAPLITKANLDLLTKLDETLPISLPIVGTLLDEAVSTPANVEQVSLSTALSSITMTNDTSPNPMITKMSSQLSDKPMMTTTSKLTEKSSENPMIAMEPMSSQTPIKSTTSSKLTGLTSMVEADSSTLTTNMDSTSTMNDTTA